MNMLIQSLEELRDIQADSGCNDFIVDKTPDNIKFAEIFNLHQNYPGNRLNVEEDKITGGDVLVTQYFIDKLQRMKTEI